MKGQWRGFFVGVVMTLLVCAMFSTAYAQTGKVMQELEYRNIKVTLDGKELDLRNAIGDKVEPFMFGGTNYLPVRALSEALGLNVSWDGAHATVVLKTPQQEELPADTTPAQSEEPEFASGETGSHHISIIGVRTAKSSDGKPAFVVTYEWTNKSEETSKQMTTISVSAFQNGVGLEGTHALADGSYDIWLGTRDVRPGGTITMEAAFILSDTTSPVEVDFYDMWDFSDNVKHVVQIFSI